MPDPGRRLDTTKPPTAGQSDEGRADWIGVDVDERTATPERWLPVRDYEDRYQVSDQGRVRSLRSGRILKPSPSGYGYPAVGLCRNGESRTVKVHRLVALAFLGTPPAGQEVRHKDGDRTNAHLSNLEYGTRSENTNDAVRHGTHVQASKTHCPRGHEYTPENTRVHKGIHRRQCRACTNLLKAERKRRALADVSGALEPGSSVAC